MFTAVRLFIDMLPVPDPKQVCPKASQRKGHQDFTMCIPQLICLWKLKFMFIGKENFSPNSLILLETGSLQLKISGPLGNWRRCLEKSIGFVQGWESVLKLWFSSKWHAVQNLLHVVDNNQLCCPFKSMLATNIRQDGVEGMRLCRVNLSWVVLGPELFILVEGFTGMPWVWPAFCISDSCVCLI